MRRETIFTAIWIIGAVLVMAWQGQAGVALYLLGVFVGAGSVVNAKRRHSGQ